MVVNSFYFHVVVVGHGGGSGNVCVCVCACVGFPSFVFADEELFIFCVFLDIVNLLVCYSFHI